MQQDLQRLSSEKEELMRGKFSLSASDSPSEPCARRRESRDGELEGRHRGTSDAVRGTPELDGVT